MPFRCSVLTTHSELEALRDAWDELLGRSVAGGPMLSPLWLLAWWRAFGAEGGRRLAVAAFHEGERLVGLAPLLSRTYRHRTAVPFRRLELLGTGEPEADEVCSEQLGILAERGLEQQVAGAFADALAQGALGPWDELVLSPLDAGAPIVPALVAELARVGTPADVSQVGSSYYAELPPTFAEYTARLSSGGRYLLSRSTRDVERWAGSDLAIHVATTPAGLEAGKQALFALHGERWGGRGAFASPRFRAFHEGVMAALFAQGDLELLWLTVRGEPFAAAYDLLWKGRVYYYQSGRRLDVPRNIRPGIALLGHALRRAIEAGRREYDFLGGDHRYKRELATSCRTAVGLRAVRDRAGIRERTRRIVEGGLAAARVLRVSVQGGSGGGGPEAGGTPAVLHGDLNMLRCFAGTGVRAVVLSADPDAPSFFSRHCGQRRLCASPREDPETALANLRELGKLQPTRPVLFYGDDAMLLLVSRHREALRERFRFSLPPADRVEALVDRLRFAALAGELALPVPRTLTSAARLRAAEIAALIPPPVVLKPFNHLGFRSSKTVKELGLGPVKALYAGSVDELSRMIERISAFSPEFVVQEHVPGGEDQVYSFHTYLDARRRPLGHYVGRKIRTWPRRAGVSTYLELCDAPELVRLGFEVLERLDLCGVAKLDFKRDPRTGRFYLLEVHPRFSLWNHLGAASGVNLPLLAYKDLLGIPTAPAPPARIGLRWLSLADDARTFSRSFAPAGELSLAAWLASLRGPKVYDVFAWDDAWPFVMNLPRELGRAEPPP
jgi:predicted ATP-grasp superfamily ATP-dependent carboligase